MKTSPSYLFTAWKKLILAYLISSLIGFAIGMLLMKWGNVQPARIFETSTRRLAYLLPVFEHGSRFGVDLGVLLFVWNSLGAMATMAFVHAAGLFNPDRLGAPPRVLRQVFCGRARMRLLCYLPGCARIEAEPLRRLYVWLLVPLLGMVLLGVESGLQVSTTTFLYGSFRNAVVTLLPHGVIEIPAFTLAGAVAYSAHLCISTAAQGNQIGTVFSLIESHRGALPLKIIAGCVIGALLVAGLIEAHVTPRLMQML